jgi:hypothetical protein
LRRRGEESVFETSCQMTVTPRKAGMSFVSRISPRPLSLAGIRVVTVRRLRGNLVCLLSCELAEVKRWRRMGDTRVMPRCGSSADVGGML